MGMTIRNVGSRPARFPPRIVRTCAPTSSRASRPRRCATSSWGRSTSASTRSACWPASWSRPGSPCVRWKEQGGDPDLVLEVALWSVLFGLIGGRLYHVITSWDQLGDEWYAPFAIWEGGLGIWGGVALGVAVGAYVTHRRGASVLAMMDAAAPGILIAQGIGRLGNYFNQELFGGPTDLPWGARGRPVRAAGRLPRQPHVPPHLPLRDAVELRRRRADHLGRQALPAPAAGGLLPLRRDLLAGADLLGAAARGPVARVPRAAR